jgi:hypothetical protein
MGTEWVLQQYGVDEREMAATVIVAVDADAVAVVWMYQWEEVL